MKIAIVHDYLNQFGGAERVVSALHELYPRAPIFTSIYDEKNMPEIFRSMDIRVSFMQKFPLVFQFFKAYFLFYPLAFESFDLSPYDLILSSSSAWAKGVKKREGQMHVCYCHTPMRFVWRFDDYVKRERIHPWLLKLLQFMLEPVKNWDLQNSKAVDFFIANSRNVAERIEKTYGRPSVIISPPVESNLFVPQELEHDYFLLVSRLNTYKRIDIVIEAFNQLDLPLKVIGEGPDRKNLEKMAGPNIEFQGKVYDRDLAGYLAGCRALIFPGEEDFGIVPLEAMSSGRPVIAYRAGGAAETIIDGETGIFFEKQTPQSLAQAIKKFQFETFNKAKIREHAKQYDKEAFKARIKDYIERLVK